MLEEILGIVKELIWLDWAILIPVCIGFAIFGAFFTHIGDRKPFEHWLVVDEVVPKKIKTHLDGTMEVLEWKTRKKILDWGSWPLIAKGIICGTLTAVTSGSIFNKYLESIGLGLDFATWIISFFVGVFVKAIWDWKNKAEKTILRKIKEEDELDKIEKERRTKALMDYKQQELTDEEKKEIYDRLVKDGEAPSKEPTLAQKITEKVQKKVEEETLKVVDNIIGDREVTVRIIQKSPKESVIIKETKQLEHEYIPHGEVHKEVIIDEISEIPEEILDQVGEKLKEDLTIDPTKTVIISSPVHVDIPSNVSVEEKPKVEDDQEGDDGVI